MDVMSLLFTLCWQQQHHIICITLQYRGILVWIERPLHCKITVCLVVLSATSRGTWREEERALEIVGEASLKCPLCFCMHKCVCVWGRETAREAGRVWCAICVFLCLSLGSESHTASQQLDRGRQQQGTWTSDQKQFPGSLCISAFPPLIPPSISQSP